MWLHLFKSVVLMSVSNIPFRKLHPNIKCKHFFLRRRTTDITIPTKYLMWKTHANHSRAREKIADELSFNYLNRFLSQQNWVILFFSFVPQNLQCLPGVFSPPFSFPWLSKRKRKWSNFLNSFYFGYWTLGQAEKKIPREQNVGIGGELAKKDTKAVAGKTRS